MLCSYGTDYSPMLMNNVKCTNNNYLTILQCSFSTYNRRFCNSNYNDTTVFCCEFNYTLIHSDELYINVTDTTRIWNSNPYSGMIRLQGGNYSNQGRVEVYCNGQWGTICDNGFGSSDAQTICKQLGYNYYYRYNHLSL